MWEDSMALLDLGFNQLREKELVRAGTVVDGVQVANGKTDVTQAVIKDSIVVPVSQRSQDEVQTVFEISRTVSAPVIPG